MAITAYAQDFLYLVTIITFGMVITALPRPWSKKRRTR
jgi:hypothetical protein